jgi:hypothetical protein
MTRKTKQADEIGRTQDQSEASEPSGSERARDEQRSEGGPRYGGEAWEVADQRGDNRFGKARNDDAEPLEAMKRGERSEDEDQDEATSASAPAEHQSRAQANEEDDITFGDMQKAAAGEDLPHVESGGEMTGMGRGEKPRKSKSRSKK